MEIYSVTEVSSVNYPRNVTVSGVPNGIEKQGRLKTVFPQICQLMKEKLSNFSSDNNETFAQKASTFSEV